MPKDVPQDRIDFIKSCGSTVVLHERHLLKQYVDSYINENPETKYAEPFDDFYLFEGYGLSFYKYLVVIFTINRNYWIRDFGRFT